MKTKEIIIWVSVLVALVGGLWLLILAVNNSPSPETLLSKTPPEVAASDFVKGATESAKVTLIEYGDFQCPACATYFPIVKLLLSEFSKDLRVVYRNFPLTTIHKNAMLSAQTAYAAGLQGKFWEMHDILYENQADWANTSPKDTFIEYAKELELDLDKFKKDLEDSKTIEFINDQTNQATSIGVNPTPSFFVNGKYIKNPPGYDGFKKIIQDELAK